MAEADQRRTSESLDWDCCTSVCQGVCQRPTWRPWVAGTCRASTGGHASQIYCRITARDVARCHSAWC